MTVSNSIVLTKLGEKQRDRYSQAVRQLACDIDRLIPLLSLSEIKN